MELQQIIVLVIVFLCMIWAGLRIFLYFKRIKNNENPCEGCTSDCSIKSLRTNQKCNCEKMQENEEKNIKIVAGSKKSRTFATAIEKQRLQRKRVPWMSGLVSGLQNRVRRFESARNL